MAMLCLLLDAVRAAHHLIHPGGTHSPLPHWLYCVPILTFPALWHALPSKLKYLTRMTCYYTVMTTAAASIIPVSFLPRPRRPENMLRGAHLMNFLAPNVLGWTFRVRALNVDYIRRDEAFVIVVNHQHSLDVLGLFALWPEMNRCTTLSKRELMLAGPFGIVAWLCGTTFINRRNKGSSYKVLCDTVMEAKKTNTKVLVFPEGTRNHVHGKKDLLSFRPGAFAAAVSAGVPVLPVVISHYGFIDTSVPRLDSGEADIQVLPPILTNRLQMEDVPELMERTRAIMLKAYRELEVGAGECS